MKNLTERQAEVAGFIQNFIETNGYSPSVREIAANFSISVKAAHDHIKALERKEVIRSTGSLSRTLEVISDEFSPSKDVVTIPLLGHIAAGTPVLAEENWETELSFPATMITGSGLHYALRVRGDSMEGAGILDGDIALVRHCIAADNGDIVVARVGEDASVTLKRYFRHAHAIELRPENPSYGPIFTKDCQIHGKLLMIIRDYGSQSWTK